MKKYLVSFLTICFIFLNTVTVRADIVVEPANNFYEKNSEKCVFLGRNFRVNGEDGKVPVKKAPNSNINVKTLENGETIYVEYSCLYDGEYWGIVTYGIGENNGWVAMNQLLAIYDYVAFEEEHFSEFYQYTGDFKEIKKADEVAVWAWPGSGNSLSSIRDIDMGNFYVSYTFRDGQGREWGFIPYLYGSKNFWICISDPVNRDIPAFNPEPTPMKWESDTVHTEIPKTDNNLIILITALVGALVAGTAILIKVFWGTQKEKK